MLAQSTMLTDGPAGNSGDGDLMGDIWTFQELAPWNHQPLKRRTRWAALISALSVSLSVLMCGSAAVLAHLHVSARAAASLPFSSAQSMKAPVIRQLEDALKEVQFARQAAEHISEQALAELARQRKANELTEAFLQQAREQAATERSLRLAAEHDYSDALAKLTVMARRNGLAEIAVREARASAAKERRLRLAAEHGREIALRRSSVERNAGRQLTWATSPFTVSW
jgi:hypothetical protein